MSREIKFRAWDNDRKRMFSEDDFYIRYGCAWRFREFDEECKERDWVLMQYTGLKDKNGKEIYEGDIVKRDDYPYYNEGNLNYLSIVEWFDEDACWYANIQPISDRVRGCAVGGMLGEFPDLEIIGNIYENQELVKNAA